MKKLLLTTSILVGLSISLFAQKSNKETSGDKYYDYYSFDKAVESYLGAKDLSMEGQRKLADSYRHLDKTLQCRKTQFNER